MEAFDRCTRENSIFLLQHDGPSYLYQSPQSEMLLRMMSNLDGHGIIALHSHREIPAVVTLLRAHGISSCEISGHADMVSLCKNVNSALQIFPNTLVTSSNCILHIFALGLMKVEGMSFIIFDNLTGANYQHPYCIFMEVDHPWYFDNSNRHFMAPHWHRILSTVELKEGREGEGDCLVF
jgi:hypothetical protein